MRTVRIIMADWILEPPMPSLRWLSLPSPLLTPGTALLATVAPLVAQAATYATAEDVAHRAFSGATSVHEVLVTPTPADAAALTAPGAAPHAGPVRTLEVRQGDTLLGRVLVDAVVGKFEQIDYAVAVDPAGKVLAVEILSYRESHGSEVRLPAWRQQFVGKTAADPIRVGADIQNISGATLSCTHVTDGVHRLVAWAAKAPFGAKP